MIKSCLVLGGARSGKSAYAERLVLQGGRQPVYIATSPVIDAEMAERIALHRARRDARWETVEEELDLSGALQRHTGLQTLPLVDCLTLWLNNLLYHKRDVGEEIDGLVDTVRGLAGPAVFVSNEIGMGLVPETREGRVFRDWQGRLNQRLAEACTEVVFVAAGLPLHLKSSS